MDPTGDPHVPWGCPSFSLRAGPHNTPETGNLPPFSTLERIPRATKFLGQTQDLRKLGANRQIPTGVILNLERFKES